MTTHSVESIDQTRILKKHVSAIHIGAQLTLLQRKLINALLYNAYDELLTASEHTISARLLCEMIGFDSKNVEHLKNALRGLMETIVEFDVLEESGAKTWEAMSLVPFAKLSNGKCHYRFDRSLSEKLYHPDVYSKINLAVLRGMKSSHALVLYENCHRFVNIGHTGWWDLGTFRKLMAVDHSPSYERFKELNRSVIRPAVNEVNQISDIHVEMEKKSSGRTIKEVRFLVRRNPQSSLLGLENVDAISSSQGYKALIDNSIPPNLARSWMMEHGEEYILEKIALAEVQESSGKIRSSKSGFLRKSIEMGYTTPKATKNENNNRHKEAQAPMDRGKAELKRLEALNEEFNKAYTVAMLCICEGYVSEVSDGVRNDWEKEFSDALTAQFLVDDFNKKKWRSSLLFSYISEFLQGKGLSLPSPEDWATEKDHMSPRQLKADIDAARRYLSQLVVSN